MTKPGELTEKKINIVWDGMEEDSSNGVIAILNFSKPKKLDLMMLKYLMKLAA